jgi:hypothetical protein
MPVVSGGLCGCWSGSFDEAGGQRQDIAGLAEGFDIPPETDLNSTRRHLIDSAVSLSWWPAIAFTVVVVP